MLLRLMEEPEDWEGDCDNSPCTEAWVDSVPPDNLDPSELKALFAKPPPVRNDHLLEGFSELLAGW